MKHEIVSIHTALVIEIMDKRYSNDMRIVLYIIRIYTIYFFGKPR